MSLNRVWLAGLAGLAALGLLIAVAVLSAQPGPSTLMTSTGDGPGGSTAMDLVEGDYILRWSATPSDLPTCQHRAALETTDELVIRPLMDEKVTGSATEHEIVLDDLPAGQYYIDVNSNCGWTFTLKPAS